MSSNIRITRVCQYCGCEFQAKTTVTKYCSEVCGKRHYKARKRDEKVKVSNAETKAIVEKPLQEIQSKEILTVRDAAKLLSCSIRTVYNLIDRGTLNGIRFSERKTLLRRSDIDQFFENAVKPVPKRPEKPLNIKDCYHMGEIQMKYNISEAALYQLIKRNKITKVQHGWYVYVSKSIIDQLLNPFPRKS
jgi:excisionase family DNA binding protein